MNPSVAGGIFSDEKCQPIRRGQGTTDQRRTIELTFEEAQSLQETCGFWDLTSEERTALVERAIETLTSEHDPPLYLAASARAQAPADCVREQRAIYDGDRIKQQVRRTTRRLVAPIIQLAERRVRLQEGKGVSAAGTGRQRKEHARAQLAKETDLAIEDIRSFRNASSTVIPTPHELNNLVRMIKNPSGTKGGGTGGPMALSFGLQSATGLVVDGGSKITPDSLHDIALEVGIPSEQKPPSREKKDRGEPK